MDVSVEAKRRAYGTWLRTGRWPVAKGADGTEWKFNPWHDPKDGRFTTANGGDDAGSSRQSVSEKTGLRSRSGASSSATDIWAGRQFLEKAVQTTAKAEFDFARGVSDGAYDTVKSGIKSAVQFITRPISINGLKKACGPERHNAIMMARLMLDLDMLRQLRERWQTAAKSSSNSTGLKPTGL